QVEIYKAAVQTELRAYLVVGKCTIEPSFDTKRPRVTWDLKNVGKTPAFATRIQHGFLPGDHISTSHFRLFDTRPDTNDVFILGPDITLPQQLFLKRNLTDAEIQLMKDKKTTLFAFGIIFYEDVFGISHKTFFASYTKTGQPPPMEGSIMPTKKKHTKDKHSFIISTPKEKRLGAKILQLTGGITTLPHL
ncbi:MAG: hypothetical protein Q7R79_04025, partial [bacterium]|nr:hypothetical protein [bacterium]